MSFDGIFLHHMTAELQPLVGGRIQKINHRKVNLQATRNKILLYIKFHYILIIRSEERRVGKEC